MAIPHELVYVGDRSSSMESLGDSPWKGAMEWANMQADEAQKNSHESRITLVAFDDIAERVLNAVPTKNWKTLKEDQVQEWFTPRGCTRLYDTVIEELELLQKRKKNRGGGECHAVFAVFTDGEDNVSDADNTDMNFAVMKARAEGVACFFLAANQDAIASGLKYGFDSNQCLTTGDDPTSSSSAYEALSSVFTRTLGTSSSTAAFTPVERVKSAPLHYKRRK